MKKRLFFIGLLFMTIYSFGQMKVTSDALNLRTSAEVKDNKICVIPKGTVITVIQDTIEYDSWSRINYKGKTGYVNNSFLKDITSDSKSYEYNNTTHSDVKYYKNSKGEKVQSPTKYDSAPSGASAECYDGTYSFSRSRRGTCSHHGGVKRWL